MIETPGNPFKLFMLLLGSKAPGRNVEQHDFYFGIANHLKDLIPEIKTFWPEAGSGLHIDGWREVNYVSGYRVSIRPNDGTYPDEAKLFFINLGGYQAGVLEEQHYTLLGVYNNKAEAVQSAKKTIFYKQQSLKGIKGANAHIDEKYGIDVDDVYRVDDILSSVQKQKFSINLMPSPGLPEDTIHLGYLTMDKLARA